MSLNSLRVGTAVLTALAACGWLPSASASDAQVRATIIRGIVKLNHERVLPLSTDLLVIRATLQAEQAKTPKLRVAKSLALTGFHYSQLAAMEQAQAAQDMTDAHFNDLANFDPAKADAAQVQLGLAVTNQTAGAKLLQRAASLIGYRVKVK